MLGISSCATRYRDLEQDDWSATWVDLRMSHARPAGVLEPTQRTNPAERNSRVRPFHLIAIFAAVVATQLVSVVPARAAVDDLACSYDHVSYNACLDFEDVGELGKLDAHVGLDSFMSEYAARDLIAHGGDFRASLWADDDHDQFIADLTLEPGWPTAGAGGLRWPSTARVSAAQSSTRMQTARTRSTPRSPTSTTAGASEFCSAPESCERSSPTVTRAAVIRCVCPSAERISMTPPPYRGAM